MENYDEISTTEVKLPNKSPEITPEVQKVAEATVRAEAPTQPPTEPATYAPNVSRPQSVMYCKECGSQISSKAEICPKCGARVAEAPGSSSKNKTTAALLALFFGGIGMHKFYLGKTGMGVLYLVFCWTLIPAIIAFIEAIQLFSMSESEFSMKYR